MKWKFNFLEVKCLKQDQILLFKSNIKKKIDLEIEEFTVIRKMSAVS